MNIEQFKTRILNILEKSKYDYISYKILNQDYYIRFSYNSRIEVQIDKIKYAVSIKNRELQNFEYCDWSTYCSEGTMNAFKPEYIEKIINSILEVIEIFENPNNNLDFAHTYEYLKAYQQPDKILELEETYKKHNCLIPFWI
jgi:hypothetical protein